MLPDYSEVTKQRVSQVYQEVEVNNAYERLAYTIQTSREGSEGLTIVMILKGGAFVGLRVIDEMVGIVRNLRMGFIGYHSYDGVLQQNGLQCTYGLDLTLLDVKDRHVWIIDDIFDTGKTMQAAEACIRGMEPKTLSTCTLVYRLREGSVVVKPTVVGLVYPEKDFLVGCGLGYNEEYRNLRSIYKIVPEEGIGV